MDEERLHVLLVEDSPADARLFCETLRDSGECFEVTHVETLSEAERRLGHNGHVDVVLLDLTLPDSRGLCGVKRMLQAAPDVPVVVLTGLDDEAVATAAIHEGAQDYLVKGDAGGRMLSRAVRYAVQRARLEAERQRLEAHARAAAEEANRAKSQFLANVSHELRTPMTAILGMTELALGEQLSGSVRDYLQTARDSAQVLLTLLNEVLDFSRIEAGKMELESQPLALRQVLDETMKGLAVRAHERRLELTCEIDDDVPERLVGDPLRLRQVLNNLVGNAVKFTDQGEVAVRVEVVDRGEGMKDLKAVPQPSSLISHHSSVVLRFSVRDTGIGISEEDQKRIFAPFTQADPSMTRLYGGTGLGLTIAASLVALMGGRLSVESELGKGSRFSFTARFTLQPPNDAAPGPDDAALEPLRSRRVLVADPSEANRRVLEKLLARWSIEVEAAADGQAALASIHAAVAAKRPFPLAFLAAHMPGIDGLTLVEWLRNDPQLVAAAVLMVSSTDRRELGMFNGVAQGAVCLDKPVSQAGLVRAVAKALGRPRLPEPAPPAAAPGPAPVPRRLRILLAEDTPANQKLVTKILQKRGHKVVIAQNGQEAVDLVRQREFDLVLMDVQMPVMDGFEATAVIRTLADPVKARVPVVAMTAHALKGDRDRCLAAGMDDYVSKPIDSSGLVAKVESRADHSAERAGSGKLEP